MELSTVPSSLMHIKTAQTASSCGDVKWQDESHLICCLDNGIEIRDINLILKKSIKIPGKIYKFVYQSDGIKFFYKVHCNGGYAAYYGTDENPKKQLFGPILPSGYHDSNMTYADISDSRFFVLDPTKVLTGEWTDYQILKFNEPCRINGTETFGEYLISKREKGVLFRMSVSGPQMKDVAEVWTCRQLDHPTGPTVNSSGLIFVPCGTGDHISLISHGGK